MTTTFTSSELQYVAKTQYSQRYALTTQDEKLVDLQAQQARLQRIKLDQVIEMYGDISFNPSRGLQKQNRSSLLWSLRLQLVRNAPRVLDVAISCLSLVFIFPIMLITAIAIKLDSPGPIAFKQARIGKGGKQFVCYKFRSMFIDAEQRKKDLLLQNEVAGPMFKMANDPRVTRVGRFIRKASIDELPQLFNVLQGDMSLVGPRPPLPDEVDVYELCGLRRLEVRPGITGLPQVSGRSDLDFEQWVALDVKFIAEQGPRQYIRILWRTIPTVLFGRGAY